MTRTLTFVPGTMCDDRVWRPVWSELGKRFASAYLPIETRPTREGMRDLFREAGAAAPLHLVAFSMGGYLALEHALDHPDQVASLIVVGSSAYGLSPGELAERRRMIEWLSTNVYRGIPAARLNQFVHPTHQSDPNVVDVMRAMDHDLGQGVLLAQLSQTSERVSLAPRLGDLRIPVLLIGADRDPYLSVEALFAMAALIPNARAELAADAGHAIPLEQPAWLAARIAEFHEGVV